MEQVLPLQYLKGIGPKRAEVLAKEGLRTPQDVLLYVPRGYVNRDGSRTLAELAGVHGRDDVWARSDAATLARVTSEVTIIVGIVSMQEGRYGRGKTMLTVTVADGSGVTAQVVFWNMVEYYKRVLEPGRYVVMSGRPEFDQRWNRLSFTHPELERIDDDDVAGYRAGVILPNYTLTQGMRNAGITMKLFRQMVDQVIERTAEQMTDPLPDALRAEHNLVTLQDALRELHRPTVLANVVAAQRRMKFEELFFFELLLAARASSRKRPDRGCVVDPKSPRARALVDRLPFTLTTAQRRVIREIVDDMSSGTPMNRLLQGDVGSGKTVVALLSMLDAIDSGYQTLIMAPTEILAEQHYNGIRRMVDGLDVNVVQLVGGQRKKIRAEVAEAIASGQANIIVGTHALFEASITYQRLGLIVIDEQHRFGVAQRAALSSLAKQSFEDRTQTPHILVMSATPIPRTLSMTLYGDLDVSVIDELPANRKPIRTEVVFESQLSVVHEMIRAEIRRGRQAYIVYPLVEKSDKLELKSAVEHHETLQHEVFPDLRVGLLHGQMLWYEKEDVMRAFLQGDYDILVATTVVEVGVDVPNATVMLIENAERFGLSQLHQLRGRVGRGAEQSYCYLATKDYFRYQLQRSETAADRASAAIRLRTMEETTDGFRIAEVDLKLRGPGDMLGTRQSGLPEFRFVDLVADTPLIAVARDAAFGMLRADPRLQRPDHSGIRERLIALFEGSATFMTVA
ncbi:MAG: ATP-dependent DNA helicase RecG [Candidatus Kapabacteria bacterium]|nr:ATP-dependent DNA helicase RecG [Candidatus Kapabacteria bacterium]